MLSLILRTYNIAARKTHRTGYSRDPDSPTEIGSLVGERVTSFVYFNFFFLQNALKFWTNRWFSGVLML